MSVPMVPQDGIPGGAAFRPAARYVPPRPDWNRGHCELCFEKTGAGGIPGGCAAADESRRRDFHAECGWTPM